MTQSRVSYLSTEYVEVWVFVYSLLFWVWHGGSGSCLDSLPILVVIDRRTDTPHSTRTFTASKCYFRDQDSTNPSRHRIIAPIPVNSDVQLPYMGK
jgi:hypothetical protein